MRILLFFSFLLFLACKDAESSKQKSTQTKKDYALVIHGGAGTITKKNMTPEKEAAFKKALDEALTIGENILKGGGTAMDAVTKTINYLENDSLFNAGKGAVFTNEERNELDASIMDGATLKAGAVGGVQTIKNPIDAAKAVMLRSPHVLLVGKGAETFAKEQGVETVEPSYFYTQKRWNSLQTIKTAEDPELVEPDKKHGTVGCVALDKKGNIVAGTSTGGMTNKRWNRIGDSPIIGAGTYANNTTCGVSATGHGEFFIRYAVAYDIHAQMAYGRKTLEEAAQLTINNTLFNAGGEGGIVALDKFGNISMTFNTEGMYRGYITPEARYIGIYKD